MGKIWRLLLLALLLNASLATMALARPVYLADGGIIQAQKVWQEEGRIYVLLNRDSLITFSPEEINLKKTFAKQRRQVTPQPGKKSVPATVAAKAPATPGAPSAAAASPAAVPAKATPPPTTAAPAPAVPAAKVATPAAKVATPAAPAPAPAAAPAPVAKKPAPPPTVVPAPPETGPEMMGLVFLGAGLLFGLLLIASFWKVFTKAGQAGWKSLIPFYNYFVLLQIAGCPGWWFLMFFLPVVNIYFLVVMHIRLAEKFGKSALYGFALCFLGFIFFPLLAFGPATYEGEESFSFDEEG